jgi:sugar O-acyltransferase (sialic acid O-acetyltransferase NeuD family)
MKALLIGGGGHCHSVLDTILSGEGPVSVGVIAKDEENYSELKKDELIAPYLVGTDRELPELFAGGWDSAFVTLGSVGDPTGRIKVYRTLKEIGFQIPVITDPSAAVAENAVLGPGTFVGKNAIVNAGCHVGECAIINSGAILEHDCLVGDFAHISTGAVLCGEVKVGDRSHVGAGSVVRQQMEIGEGVLIGIGSVVVKNIPDHVTAYGNPCRVVE